MQHDPRIELTDANDLVSMFHQTCATYADKPAFSALGITLSFKEFEQHTQNLAAYLKSTGLQPGDRIGLCLPNLLQFPIAAFAALQAGLVLVNTNPLYSAREMRHQWSDSGIKALVVLDTLAEQVGSILDDTDIKTVITTAATDFHQPSATNDQLPCSIRFMDALTQGASLARNPVTLTGLDLAALQYTGGTTGIAKGAMLSHANLLANAHQVVARLGDTCRPGEEIFVVPLPLYHIYAFTVNLIVFFARGSHNVLIPNPRDLPGFVEQIKPFKFTGMAGLNTLFIGLCRLDSFKALDTSALKLTISGGTALTKGAAEIWQQTTGCTVSEGYGLSETSPVVCLNPVGQEKLGSIGLPLNDTEVKLVDDLDNDLPKGATGELCIRGPQVMQGYWQQPEETDNVMLDGGWLKTGDIATIDDAGFVSIVDRKKDLIIVSGQNVYPNEIEEVLGLYPGIIEAAVVGEPDAVSGEKVLAYVVAEQELDVAAIKAFCRERLVRYKIPRKLIAVEALPKSAVGKILRRALRAQ
ncbi:AMP-binding protein [Ferrimonas aestuarii]|uniref:Long-chain-fatty-acid--CoA ligase n=1 Tax=Ferrimonas aestuarii TaxID=2569539 RepID=A0A4U1BR65_9GAMM|nr:AMP-binding protein [Ferrimonas aestuarii]TKB54210.1 long-chain fatty acid--CoA ligase [Ferrimonas aestuarii]